MLATKDSIFLGGIWRLWLKHGYHAVQEISMENVEAHCFVSQQCFVGIQLSCDFVVLFICHFRDMYPHLWVSIAFNWEWLFWGVFFPPKIGGMNCLIQLTFLKIHDIEYVENGLKFNKKNHNKMKTIGPNYILLEIVKPLVILVSMATLEHVPRLC